MKKFLSGLLIGLILTTATPVIAKEVYKTIKVKENIVTIKYNNISKTKQKTYIINNQVYVPLSTMGYLFDKKTTYNSKTNLIELSFKNLTATQKYDLISKDSTLKEKKIVAGYIENYELNNDGLLLWDSLNQKDKELYLKTKVTELMLKTNEYSFHYNLYNKDNKHIGGGHWDKFEGYGFN